MAEIATIARPYAEALFKAAGSEAVATSAWLDELAVVASNDQLRQFADNPKSTAEQVYGVVTGVLKTALPTMGQNFLRTVIENGRLAALPEIADQFRALKNAQLGSFDAVVHSAFDMDQAALADLQGVLEKRFGRKLTLKVRLDPELIGGVRVVVGDEVLDTSVKARLEQMKVALTA
ncbi:MAG TPA: F0F1 ATP synthase subunit delta [Hydrogenophaga sp.]|uniref:F0F1 ATP synthase subunit delta n=1 Tax=Hydrogenophaga sp. TaxID=1904254 RepID=UPI002CB97864|nr:F0F1 ATP synthase subunit delta [Hydrogenophaga sp.]HMN92096.1 F0F1 ATP synthase subunit delta [Hydrogenophaga sp.]HMP10536.1 F0F1 ATP synthase subunit delta [Hydrogenophaga sp.]